VPQVSKVIVKDRQKKRNSDCQQSSNRL